MFTLLVKAELECNEYIMTGYKARCAAWSPVIMKYTMCLCYNGHCRCRPGCIKHSPMLCLSWVGYCL